MSLEANQQRERVEGSPEISGATVRSGRRSFNRGSFDSSLARGFAPRSGWQHDSQGLCARTFSIGEACAASTRTLPRAFPAVTRGLWPR